MKKRIITVERKMPHISLMRNICPILHKDTNNCICHFVATYAKKR